MTVKLIDENQHLVSAATGGGHEIRTWDDGFGPLWVYRESTGVVGVVRSEKFETAYSTVIDEIMPDADPNDPENQPDADGNFPECIHWRNSGVPANKGLKSPIAQEDPAGNSLEGLTFALFKELELRLVINDEAERESRALGRRGDRRIWWYGNVRVTASHRWSDPVKLELLGDGENSWYWLDDAIAWKGADLRSMNQLMPCWWHEWAKQVKKEIEVWRKTFE